MYESGAERGFVTLERFLNVDELAEVLGVSTKHVHRRVREGCPSYLFGGSRRFLLSEVVAWARERERPGLRLVSTR